MMNLIFQGLDSRRFFGYGGFSGCWMVLLRWIRTSVVLPDLDATTVFQRFGVVLLDSGSFIVSDTKMLKIRGV